MIDRFASFMDKQVPLFPSDISRICSNCPRADFTRIRADIDAIKDRLKALESKGDGVSGQISPIDTPVSVPNQVAAPSPAEEDAARTAILQHRIRRADRRMSRAIDQHLPPWREDDEEGGDQGEDDQGEDDQGEGEGETSNPLHKVGGGNTKRKKSIKRMKSKKKKSKKKKSRKIKLTKKRKRLRK